MELSDVELNDAELVAASVNGDRKAFGQIVLRYQGMVSGLIYADCGNLHRSEDLAQEAFLSAWKSLPSLHDPAKLAGWLCQIARRRIADQARRAASAEISLAAAGDDLEDAVAAEPLDSAALAEEREIMWRALADVPQPYRETLVLYYREGQSAANVAAAMETTPEAVRQRLARGRAMLRESVAAMLERQLARSAPGPSFAMAVIAALPSVIPHTAGATVAGAATKGSAVGKGLSSLAWLGAWLGPIMGILGGIVGTRASLRAARTERERRFLIRAAIAMWLFVLGAMALLFGLGFAGNRYWSRETSLMLQATFWASYCVLLNAAIVVFNRRHAAILREQGTLPAMSPAATATRGSRFRGQLGGLTGGILGGLAWMVGMALQAGDTLSAISVTIAAAALIGWATYRLWSKPQSSPRGLALQVTAGIAAVTLVMLNFRFQAWIAMTETMDLAEVERRVPLWAVNLLAGILFCSVATMMAAVFPKNAPAADSPRSVD